MKSFFDAGVHVASASDFPVTWPPDPLDGIQLGVMRWFPGYPAVWEYPAPPSLEGVLWPEERVTVEQMMRSHTIEGAYANFLEDETGSIELGKSADLIIVDPTSRPATPRRSASRGADDAVRGQARVRHQGVLRREAGFTGLLTARGGAPGAPPRPLSTHDPRPTACRQPRQRAVCPRSGVADAKRGASPS